MNRPVVRLAAALAFATLAQGALAQSSVGKVFRDKDVDENALIQALTPDEPVRTRSIRVRPEAPSPGAQAAAARPAQASLLITFETNSADLTERSKAALDVVARALKSDRLAEFSFSVEGHADPRGGHDLNMRLSQSRAESVVEYLVTQHNLPRERLQPVGKGDQELANPTAPSAAENRRVTIKTQVR